MESFNFLEFKFEWRSYQKRLLENYEEHISDNHFHVIAPPGSGKTILGIEIIRCIGKKTLVLAPTLTIRNQWEDRLQSFFAKQSKYLDYSFDIKSPSDITFSTYQSLHAFYKSFDDKDGYFKFFKKHNIETLVLDEAHHLKNAWWTCLFELKNNSDLKVVSLTATPPYDSSGVELTKYFKLCGEVDEEIAVPDLVREEDLCPHQDFIYFSKPKDIEINFIVEYRRKITEFQDDLIIDSVFINFLKNHRFYSNTKTVLEELYSNTEYFSSILIFLNACGVAIDKYKLEVLGFSKRDVVKFPKLELHWLQVLLQNILVTDREQLIAHETYLDTLDKKLRRLNVFEKKRIDFVGEDVLYKSLTFSPSKLNSIVEIVKAEKAALNKNLNCVILTDYIRKEFLDTTNEDFKKINRIGVIPIFKYLQKYYDYTSEIAVLTGSLVIIHESILVHFKALHNTDDFTFKRLNTDTSFLIVTAKVKANKSIVSSITSLFENGYIKILVGTKSLLGEGWDAPSINSLILASFVGSFVSSNQMRGRAIRKDADTPNKTGNIWHLACLDPTDEGGGREIDTLKRRFNAFVGVTNNNIPYISNGMDRLDIPERIPIDRIEALNKATVARASQREKIAEKWTSSIGKGTRLTRQVQLLYLDDLSFKQRHQVYYFDVVRFFVIELLFSVLLFSLEYVLDIVNVVVNDNNKYIMYSLVGSFLVFFGLKLYKAIKLYIRYGYLDKKIRKIGLAILDTLYEMNHISSNFNSIDVVSQRVGRGDVFCSLIGANNYENTLFSNALKEILNPVESPRYIIIKTNFFRRKFDIENFYPVPELFGNRKANALIFKKHWKHHLGRSKLIFARTIEGRKLLLKAKLFHAYNAFKEVTKELMVWR